MPGVLRQRIVLFYKLLKFILYASDRITHTDLFIRLNEAPPTIQYHSKSNGKAKPPNKSSRPERHARLNMAMVKRSQTYTHTQTLFGRGCGCSNKRNVADMHAVEFVASLVYACVPYYGVRVRVFLCECARYEMCTETYGLAATATTGRRKLKKKKKKKWHAVCVLCERRYGSEP